MLVSVRKPSFNALAMNLDHTRPLAFLWPLEGTATALCGDCNSKKSDKPPASFYDAAELKRLAGITTISLAELQDPSPKRRRGSPLAEVGLIQFF